MENAVNRQHADRDEHKPYEALPAPKTHMPRKVVFVVATVKLKAYNSLVMSLFCFRWFLKSGTRLCENLLSAMLVH